MSLEVIDGFDTGIPALLWDSVSFTGLTTGGRFGGLSTGSDTGSTSSRLLLQKSLQQVPTRIFGAAFFPTYNSGLNTDVTAIFSWMDMINSTEQVGLYANGVGQLYFKSGATILASTVPFFFRLDAWYYIECSVTIGNPGTFELRVGQSTILSGTGVTRQTANNYTDGIRISPAGIFANTWFYIDDLYVLNTLGTKNNTFLGEQKVVTGKLTSDYFIQFSRNTGSSNYGNLLTYDGDTTYNYDNVINDKDLFTAEHLSVSPNSYGEFYTGNDISAMKATIIARKNDTGYRNISLLIQSGYTTVSVPFNVVSAGYSLGITVPLLSTYEGTFTIQENDPNTTIAWTEAGINAILVGYQLIGQ